MFSQSLQSHKEQKKKTIEQLKQVQAQTEQSAEKLCDTMFDKANAEVFQVYQWEGKLESEVQRLRTAVSELSSQLERWQATLKPLEAALKELGDIENWSTVLDNRVSQLVDSEPR